MSLDTRIVLYWNDIEFVVHLNSHSWCHIMSLLITSTYNSWTMISMSVFNDDDNTLHVTVRNIYRNLLVWRSWGIFFTISESWSIILWISVQKSGHFMHESYFMISLIQTFIIRIIIWSVMMSLFFGLLNQFNIMSRFISRSMFRPMQ